MGSNDVYKERAESVLVLLSDLYFKEEILVCNNKLSSCYAYMFY